MTFLFRTSLEFRSSWVRGDFTAFQKINSGIGIILRSFRMAYSLGMRSFVWIGMISVSLLIFGHLLEKVWWSASQR